MQWNQPQNWLVIYRGVFVLIYYSKQMCSDSLDVNVSRSFLYQKKDKLNHMDRPDLRTH